MLLYAITVFLSSFLLFQVQPILAKMILPWFGGSAAVWNACMLFFQAALLAGYTYAHLLFAKVPARRAGKIHTGLLALSLLTLPILPGAAWKPTGGENPALQILGLLTATVGLPYFLLSTTGPLLQAWYARQHSGATPYRLFALSNAASLLALLSYPALVEPRLDAQTQAWVWSGAFALFVLLCARVAWSASGEVPASEEPEPAPPAPAWALPLLWVGLAAVPAILLLTVTTHLTQDVAAIPFLWIVPLVLYLLTFILCFEASRLYWRWFYLPLAAAALFGVAWLAASDSNSLSLPQSIAGYAAAMFVCSMVCHGELASLKPHPRFLTSFYVGVSTGGVLGGLIVGLIAPNYFDAFYEFPLGWVLAGLAGLAATFYRHQTLFSSWRGGAAAIVLVALAGGYAGWWVQIESAKVRGYRHVQRNFYGMLRIQDEGDFTDQTRVRQLLNGVINHGQQFLHPFRRKQATTYYCAESGAGQAIATRKDGVAQRVGVIGLGAGTLASYGRRGDEYHFYEINPAVIRYAEGEFTFLSDSPANKQIHLGDARLTLERQRPMGFDVLLVDAFSGDSVPVHLLTAEAFGLYFRHLKPDGILAVHISNKYLNLEPVVAANAGRMGLTALEFSDDRPDSDETCFGTTWVLLLTSPGLSAHTALAPRGKPMPEQADFRPWTDAFSNMWSILRK
ncbi:MAG: fused MFS/spermidine synthase [Acidobacteria bacterium]|nr:fused MFS/spermidine synthase [Bryobacteraceae bacterium CoA2 C42]